VLRIALLGTRGIPANYGGFETFAEELSTRLAARGHEVTVYCREQYPDKTYRGVRLQYLPTIRHKYFDTLAHTFVSTLFLILQPCDVALYCNAANALFTILPRARGIPIALNVDGIERKRRKWNWFAKTWYLISEYFATLFPNRIVADAKVIQDYYLERYGKSSTFIAYGADARCEETDGALVQLNLQRRKYFLYVSRFEPENHPLEVRRAFEQAFEHLDTDMKLALIGDAPHAQEYIREVRNTDDPRVVIPGAVYGLGYRELGSHCFDYIQATEVGGTHPALIEQMGRGALVIYRNTPENAEVCRDCGIPFENEAGLVQAMELVLNMPEPEREAYRARARRRVRERYDWDVVTTQYEALFVSLVS
jgi:glycosyltransferase involved in cell wall biosynthesis